MTGLCAHSPAGPDLNVWGGNVLVKMYSVTSGAARLNSGMQQLIGGEIQVQRLSWLSSNYTANSCILHESNGSKKNLLQQSNLLILTKFNSKVALRLCPSWISRRPKKPDRPGANTLVAERSICPFFPIQPCSVEVLELKYCCDWKLFSQFNLPLVEPNLKRQNKPSFSLITWLPWSSATRWNWRGDLDERNANCQSLITRTFYTFT